MFAYWPALVPLLFLAGFLLRGRRRKPGLLKPYASIDLRVPGTRTQATGTTADFSSYLRPGSLSVEWATPMPPHLASKYGAPGSSTDVTETPGGNGGQHPDAD